MTMILQKIVTIF